MKLATIAYVPPPHLTGSKAFFENVTQWKTSHELILFGDPDHKWGDSVIRLKQSPEIAGRRTSHAISNLVWFTAMRIALRNHITHFIYLESDCRVGPDKWDQVIFDEMFQDNGDRLPCGGGMVTYGASNVDLKFFDKWTAFIAKNHSEGKSGVPCYGAGGAAQQGPPRILVNGALAVYSVAWMQKLFHEGFDNAPEKAKVMTAWDFEMGKRLYQHLGYEIFDNMRHLRCVWSTFGNVLSDEDYRQKLLESGKVVGVHQIESNWKPNFQSLLAPAPVAITIEAPVTAAEVLHVKVEGNTLVVEPTPKPVPTKDSTSILIVSHLPHLAWLKWCIKSIAKFASGFESIEIVWPDAQQKALSEVEDLMPLLEDKMDIHANTFIEMLDKGHLHHEAMKCMADTFCDSAFFLHMDCDCVFTEPVTPADYFVDGKPVLLKEPYEGLIKSGDNRRLWKLITEATLGFETPYETMCRHPAVHPREIYLALRDHIEELHGMPFEAYVLAQHAEFPYGFCEFNSLGGYALDKCPDWYHWIDVSKVPAPPNKMRQFWSHKAPNITMDPKFGSPVNYFKKVLGL